MKWRQSTAETKLRDRKTMSSKVRSPTELIPQCGETNNFIVKQNSIVITTPVLVNTEAASPTDVNLNFDCLQPRDSVRKQIVIKNEATGYSASNGKSDSC